MPVAEALMFVAITGAVLVASLHRYRGRDRLVTTATVGFACLLCVGQISGRSDEWYPFVSWRMYTSPHAPTLYYEFKVTNSEGDNYYYPFEILLPWTPGPLSGYSMLSPITQRLINMQLRCRCERGDSELDRMIEALVRIHQKHSRVGVSRFAIIATPRSDRPTSGEGRGVYSWSVSYRRLFE